MSAKEANKTTKNGQKEENAKVVSPIRERIMRQRKENEKAIKDAKKANARTTAKAVAADKKAAAGETGGKGAKATNRPAPKATTVMNRKHLGGRKATGKADLNAGRMTKITSRKSSGKPANNMTSSRKGLLRPKGIKTAVRKSGRRGNR